MKKYLLSIAGVLVMSSTYAQRDSSGKDSETAGSEFNKWSIELNVGQNKPQSPFGDGYFSADPGEYFNFAGAGVNHYDIGVRYMFNQYFGAKLDFAFDSMENQSGTTSIPFETQQYRVGLQGVVNLSRLMKFESFTKRFGILAHAGLQVSQLDPKMGINSNTTEDNGGFIIGLTPQLRISNRIVLTADFTYLNNVRQHLNWDGSFSNSDNNLGGTMLNSSLGVTFYLGGKEVHADWYVVDTKMGKELEAVEKRIAAIEDGLVDSDQDGIADMFDVEPNTMAGISTDSKGRTIDRNSNGVADELERYFESKYGTDIAVLKAAADGADFDVKRLINEGYVNAYFDFNSRQPTSLSVDALNFIRNYLKANSAASAEIIGYADEIGGSEFNNELSLARAQNVRQTLIESGIDGSRLIIKGNGQDKSVDKSSKQARMIVRRVTFKIK
jgi:OOP family OmpA-OmpF porin